ncbi:hypothetical protein AJ79_07496 [Helicocarpus griseus UAMH5409]|uniref:Uncharacterized protein n=1 Tax=Helicocarpus griseus UAMH5409 TaxID=1447875 RepID=A0A2B7X245_9EURO|nr:hypothetical protein AJ79_07496 [Helicocarpus griseus UAMH5409]
MKFTAFFFLGIILSVPTTSGLPCHGGKCVDLVSRDPAPPLPKAPTKRPRPGSPGSPGGPPVGKPRFGSPGHTPDTPPRLDEPESIPEVPVRNPEAPPRAPEPEAPPNQPKAETQRERELELEQKRAEKEDKIKQDLEEFKWWQGDTFYGVVSNSGKVGDEELKEYARLAYMKTRNNFGAEKVGLTAALNVDEVGIVVGSIPRSTKEGEKDKMATDIIKDGKDWYPQWYTHFKARKELSPQEHDINLLHVEDFVAVMAMKEYRVKNTKGGEFPGRPRGALWGKYDRSDRLPDQLKQPCFLTLHSLHPSCTQLQRALGIDWITR